MSQNEIREEKMGTRINSGRPSDLVRPPDAEGFSTLMELALDLRWSWDHATDAIWRRLDPKLWESTRNPWIVLQTASRERIRQVLQEPFFRQEVDGFLLERRRELVAPAWFQNHHPGGLVNCIAYFSMEFMLSEALPIYSGGLGNVAGDQLKAASDLGIPVIGIGLLYQQGYFRQIIDRNGAQQALYPYNDPGQLPITPTRREDGEWLHIDVQLPGYAVRLRVWQVKVGRVKLYLLDSNDAANYPAHRGITGELYGGGAELRLQQEMLLGIGGWRLFGELGIRPEVCHLNEGHAAFAVLERARSHMLETGQPFDAALSVTRAGNIFTTHTAVHAGFDRFDPQLVEQYLGHYAKQALNLPFSEFMALGRANPEDASEPFNMAFLAIRGSGAVNGVSQLHGKVARHLFEPLFPRWPSREVPVGHVTNGVHVPSWDSPEAEALWAEACGLEPWVGESSMLDNNIRNITDERLWQFRIDAGQSFVRYIRMRMEEQLTVAGASRVELAWVKSLFSPEVLTIGFARRFTSYKRPNLLLADPKRLLRLLSHAERPVQLVIAGKAHPADREGQALIQAWTDFTAKTSVRSHAVFLSDYDMNVSEHLVQGVDVWLNTPRYMWEASGTSGMKVLANGGMNLSELDGWWAEAYSPDLGWALGGGQNHESDPEQDALEAEQLYRILEEEVVPEFYNRGPNGIPEKWVGRMRESMARLTPQFSASRSVREYLERYYLPAAASYRNRMADNGAVGRRMYDWQLRLSREWHTIRFIDVNVKTDNERHVFEVLLHPGNVDPDMVRVELYDEVDAPESDGCREMSRDASLPDKDGCFLYRMEAPAAHSWNDYAVRVIPRNIGLGVPLEESHILWDDRADRKGGWRHTQG